jgi:MoaA/NifB/PqqE/SkfB family radical SAM enzyme
LEDPDYDVEEFPSENPIEPPYRLPEERLVPYAVTWGVTHACNLRCTTCYDVVDYKRHSLNTAEALSVIDRLASAGISFIVFAGGEPLVRNDLFQLMEHCRTRNIGIGLRSNGVFITTGVARRLAELQLAVAGVSLDGATEQSHDRIRGQGLFQKTIAGIHELVTAKIRVNIEVVLSRCNAPESLQFVQLAENLGVQEINFSALAPQGRVPQLMSQDVLDHNLWRELTSTLYNASLTAKVSVSPSCALTGNCWSCVEPNITCDGWVTPCYLSKRKLFHILNTPSEEIKARLRENRPATLNICGRERWMKQDTLK